MSDLPSLDPDRIFPVYAGSNELSPFHRFYANDKTVLRLAAGRLFAHHNGDDPVVGYWALRRAAALYDVPERPLEISGPDAIRFLERLLTRRVADMAPYQGRYVLACTHEGGLFMDGILFRMGESRFWFVQPDGDLETWILAQRPGYHINLRDPGSRVLQLQGPKSLEIMHEASGGEISSDLKYFHGGYFDLGGDRVFVSRTGWTGELGYEIYTHGTETNCQRLWNHLLATGEDKGMVFSSMQSMNIRRIEAGILDNGSDFDISMTPYEAGLGRFVDMRKGEFIGRDALGIGDRKPRIHGLKLTDGIPVSGDPVFEGDTKIGYVTTGAYSPQFECGIGYLRADKMENWAGRTLSVSLSTGAMAKCEVIELPFYDPLKMLARRAP